MYTFRPEPARLQQNSRPFASSSPLHKFATTVESIRLAGLLVAVVRILIIIF